MALTMSLSKSSSKRTLLLVDDEPANLHVLKQILQDDYILLFAKDGKSALEICRGKNPDLILLDINLPEMNGYEVCQLLKQDSNTARIPVIFISAMKDVADEAHGFEAGGVDYITKPVNHAIVKARVATHLSLVHIEELKQAEQKLAESHEELRNLTIYREEARELERKRIAQDLHDDLGQKLTGLRMQVSLLKIQYGSENPALAKQVTILKEYIDETIQVVRDVAAQLRPAVLDMGIVSALEWQTEGFTRMTGIHCTLVANNKNIELNSEQSTTIFRIVQESLTNIMRHAHAKQVEVKLTPQKESYLLEVTDDGIGFDMNSLRNKTFGLIGMRERALVLDGEYEIHSALGQGTKLTIRIPFIELE
jgi:signal transduction histidine kinase